MVGTAGHCSFVVVQLLLFFYSYPSFPFLSHSLSLRPYVLSHGEMADIAPSCTHFYYKTIYSKVKFCDYIFAAIAFIYLVFLIRLCFLFDFICMCLRVRSRSRSFNLFIIKNTYTHVRSVQVQLSSALAQAQAQRKRNGKMCFSCLPHTHTHYTVSHIGYASNHTMAQNMSQQFVSLSVKPRFK